MGAIAQSDSLGRARNGFRAFFAQWCPAWQKFSISDDSCKIASSHVTFFSVSDDFFDCNQIPKIVRISDRGFSLVVFLQRQSPLQQSSENEKNCHQEGQFLKNRQKLEKSDTGKADFEKIV